MSAPIASWTDAQYDDYLASHLTPTAARKEQNGEVFTPPALISAVLDTLPASAWTNPAARWLEPTAGRGHFAVVLFRRLFRGLATSHPNPTRRARHIIENMLFMVELHPPHCRALRAIFGPRANIFQADATQWTPPSTANLDTPASTPTFDYIIGNPPFQDAVRRSGSKRITRAKNKLYERITAHCCQSLLSPKGHLAFIVPSNLFSGNAHALYAWMVEHAHIKQITFLSKEMGHFPHVQHAMCHFTLALNRRTGTGTRISSAAAAPFSVLLRNRVCNPVSHWTPSTEKLVARWIGDTKHIGAHAVRGKSVASYRGTKYAIAFTPNRTLRTNSTELAKGKGEKKAILFVMSPETPAFKMDWSGRMGAGPNTFYVAFSSEQEGKRIETFLTGDVFAELVASTRTTRQFVKTGMLEHLMWNAVMKGASPSQTRKRRRSRTFNVSTKPPARTRPRTRTRTRTRTQTRRKRRRAS